MRITVGYGDPARGQARKLLRLLAGPARPTRPAQSRAEGRAGRRGSWCAGGTDRLADFALPWPTAQRTHVLSRFRASLRSDIYMGNSEVYRFSHFISVPFALIFFQAQQSLKISHYNKTLRWP